MQMYKSLPAAFLFQMVVGALCLGAISAWGPAWIGVLALLGLRPVVLKRVTLGEDKNVWAFYYRITKMSVVSLSVTIILIYAAFGLFSHSSPIKGIWMLMLIPYFVFIHGLFGLIYSLRKD